MEQTPESKKRVREEKEEPTKTSKRYTSPSDAVRKILKKELEEPFSGELVDFVSTEFGSRVFAVSYFVWLCKNGARCIWWDVETTIDQKYMKFVESVNGQLCYTVRHDLRGGIEGICHYNEPVYWYKKNISNEERMQEIIKAEEEREKLAEELGLKGDEADELVLEPHNTIAKMVNILFQNKHQKDGIRHFVGDLPDLMSERLSEEMTFWFHPNEKYIYITETAKSLGKKLLTRDHAFLFECLQTKPYNNDEMNIDVTRFSLEEFRKKVTDRKVLEIIRPIFVDLFKVLLE